MNVQRFSRSAVLEAFPPIMERTSNDRAAVELADVQPLTANDLCLDALDPIRSVIDHPAGEDGSRDALRCAGDMMRDGRFTDEQIAGVLLDERNAVSAHIYRQDDPRRAALRVLSRVRGDMARNGQREGEHRGAGSNAGEAGAGAQRPQIVFLDPAEWVGRDVPPREYAIDGLFLAKSLAGLTGPGATGKSLLMQQAATAVAAGRPFLRRKTTQGPAAYLTAEDDARELHERQVSICKQAKVELGELSGKLLLASLIELGDKALVRAERFDRLTVSALFDVIRATIEDKGLKFLALDNAGHFFGADENVRAHVVAFLGLLNKLALETGCAIVLISHPNKSGAAYSGSTAWQNQIRVQAHLSRPEGEHDTNMRELRLEKANYAPPGEPIRMLWHHGAFVLEDEVPADDASRTTALQLRQNEIFYACLAVETEAQRPVSDAKTAGNYAPKMFARLPTAQGMTIAEFERTMERLFSAGMIERGQLDFNSGSTRNKAHGLRLTGRRGGDDEAPM